MPISQKCLYAIRSVFELMKRADTGRPVKIADIANAQDIPARFLESILNELKAAGFVDSKRGADGGYVLAPNMNDLSIGHVVEFIEGPLEPVSCVMGRNRNNCQFYGNCIYLPMWKKIHKTISDAYYQMKFKDLVAQDRQQSELLVHDYSI